MSRFRPHVPLFFRLLYPVSAAVYAGSLVLCIILDGLNVSNKIGTFITKLDLALGVLTVLVIDVIFHTDKEGIYDWGRWVKRRGMQKKKK